MWILVLLCYALLFFYELVPLYQQKLWRDFLANSALGIISCTMATMLSLGIQIPSPEAPIRELITGIFGK